MAPPDRKDRRPDANIGTANDRVGNLKSGSSIAQLERKHVGRSKKVERTTLRRHASAHCLECDARWEHSWALAAAAQHAGQTGHACEGQYTAAYGYAGRAEVSA